jgi:Protein of unknown function (DUF2806)
VRRRAVERLLAEETRKQRNLEAIYGKTILLLEPSTDPETINQIDEDWIFFHSEKARLVSDQEMQSLWARILAREAERPGSFSKRTLDFLAALEKSEAEDFTNLCRYVVEITGKRGLISPWISVVAGLVLVIGGLNCVSDFQNSLILIADERPANQIVWVWLDRPFLILRSRIFDASFRRPLCRLREFPQPSPAQVRCR